MTVTELDQHLRLSIVEIERTEVSHKCENREYDRSPYESLELPRRRQACEQNPDAYFDDSQGDETQRLCDEVESKSGDIIIMLDSVNMSAGAVLDL